MAWLLKKSKTYVPILIIHPGSIASTNPLLHNQPSPQFIFGYYQGILNSPYGRISKSAWDTTSLVDWQSGLDWGFPDKLPNGGR
jgi:hypothetical protein